MLAKESMASITIGLLVYQGIKLNDSYRSFEDRVLTLHLTPGTVIGTQNHSRNFPPDMVRTMFDELRQDLVDHLGTLEKRLGFAVPFSITADKDTSKHRSRQVIIKFPLIY